MFMLSLRQGLGLVKVEAWLGSVESLEAASQALLASIQCEVIAMLCGSDFYYSIFRMI